MSWLLKFITRCCVPETMRQEECLDVSEYSKNMSKYNSLATAVVRPFLANWHAWSKWFVQKHRFRIAQWICFIVFVTGFGVVIFHRKLYVGLLLMETRRCTVSFWWKARDEHFCLPVSHLSNTDASAIFQQSLEQTEAALFHAVT